MLFTTLWLVVCKSIWVICAQKLRPLWHFLPDIILPFHLMFDNQIWSLLCFGFFLANVKLKAMQFVCNAKKV